MPTSAPSAPGPLAPASLRRRCSPDDLEFTTTAELEGVDLTLGQERALEALELATGIDGGGYNAYLLGSSSVDLREMASAFLEGTATSRETPPDWCYVHNFDDAQRPVVITLPPGKGTELRDDMAQLVEELKISIPAAFESEEYQTRRNEIEQSVQQRQSEAFQKLQSEAEEKGMGIIQTPHGFAVAPIREGKVLTKEDFEKLGEQEQEQTEKTIAELSEKLRKQLQAAPLMIKEARESQRDLDRQTALIAIAAPIAGLKEKWQAEETVLAYLDEVSEDVLANVDDFQPQLQMVPGLAGLQGGPSFTRYEVNLLVDNSETDGAPVVYETMPSYMNLIGRIEHLSTFGALVTNFTLIKAGALHRANGGFLVLDAERVLSNPYAWQGLQRALLSGALRIEALDRVVSLATTVSLEPEPIPLDLKVILVGSRLLYFLLSEYVEEFGNLFKIAADFEDEFERSPENVQACARLIATLANRDELRHFDRGAVARVIEHSSRRVSDTLRLSTSVSGTADLLREADFEAGRSGSDVVTADDVQRAIDARRRRLDRIPNRMLEAIERDIVHIETEGGATGQVNGLAVIQLGDLTFGHPTRITATARLGKGEVVDVQREVKLGGAIHSKGVFILASFLGSRYAR